MLDDLLSPHLSTALRIVLLALLPILAGLLAGGVVGALLQLVLRIKDEGILFVGRVAGVSIAVAVVGATVWRELQQFLVEVLS